MEKEDHNKEQEGHFEEEHNEEYEDAEQEASEEESINDKFKKVWQDKRKRLAIMGISLCSVGTMFFFFYSLFSSNDSAPRNSEGVNSSRSYSGAARDDNSMAGSSSFNYTNNRSSYNEEDSFKLNSETPVNEPQVPMPPPSALPAPNISNISSPKVPPPKIEIKEAEKKEAVEPPPLPIFDDNSNTDNSSGEPIPIDDLPVRESQEQRQKRLARMSSDIMVFGDAVGGDALTGNVAGKENSNNSSYMGFDGGNIDKTNRLGPSQSSNVTVTKVSNLDKTLLQGKIIDAVLENAITTQLEDTSMLRAIVSRDVYAEQGKNLLIPKGSRIIGSYSNSVSDGQTRILVTWNRIITPRGIDIPVESKSTDRLGRIGVPGFTDDRFMAKLVNSFLVSYVVPMIALGITGDGDDQIVSSSDSNSSSTKDGKSGINATTSSTARAKILSDATDDFSDTAKDAIDKRYPDIVTISVDQGSLIKIMVSKDIYFPAAAIENNRNDW